MNINSVHVGLFVLIVYVPVNNHVFSHVGTCLPGLNQY